VLTEKGLRALEAYPRASELESLVAELLSQAKSGGQDA